MSRKSACHLAAIALLSGAALTACGPPPPPPASVIKPPPPLATSAPLSPPVFSLVGERVASLSCPALPAAEMGPLEPPFEPLDVPANLADIKAVNGRSERDVWMIARGQTGQARALRWDGATLSDEDISPCALSMRNPSLSFGPGGPIVLDREHDESGLFFSQAHRTPSGAWDCDQRSAPARSFTLGSQELRNVPGLDLTLSGRRLPTSSVRESINLGIIEEYLAVAADDIWVYFPHQSRVWHWNGSSWEERSPGLKSVRALVADASGAPWLIGGTQKEDWITHGPQVILRWDAAAGAWACFPTPPGLKTKLLRAASERDVWLLGDKETLHWDGVSFQRGPTPVPELEDAWIDRSGELWVVGRKSAPTGPEGVVLRARPGERQ